MRGEPTVTVAPLRVHPEAVSVEPQPWPPLIMPWQTDSGDYGVVNWSVLKPKVGHRVGRAIRISNVRNLSPGFGRPPERGRRPRLTREDR